MQTLKNIVLLLILIFFFSSCNGNTAQEKTEKADALLLWSGEYAVDGCGFAVVIGDKKFKPENEEAIPEAFKAADMTPVTIVYTWLQEKIDRRCGLSTESREMPGIRVISVQKR